MGKPLAIWLTAFTEFERKSQSKLKIFNYGTLKAVKKLGQGTG
jgi:hypothetical protein